MLAPRIAALSLLFLSAPSPGSIAPCPGQDRVERGVTQLRHAVGEWDVTTEFLAEDGSVAGTVAGTYRFHWVVPDRVLAGESDLPALGRKSAILFYVNVEKELIEMTSVGADGKLWVMTGPIDGEVRTTPLETSPDGTSVQLRFTRSAVEEDSFESRMEVSADGGKTWKPGNHQLFERRS